MGMDLWQYRTNGEWDYFQNVANIPAALLRRRRNKFEVSDDAVCFSRPLLTVAFRFVRKDSAYWRSIRDEIRDRRKTGLV